MQWHALQENAPPEAVDLLLFEVGGRVFGTDATEVVRIGGNDPDAPSSPLLGQVRHGRRSLVIASARGLTTLPIDEVLGLRSTPVTSLRRMPEFARPLLSPAVIGFLLDGPQLVLLIDLVALVKEEPDGV